MFINLTNPISLKILFLLFTKGVLKHHKANINELATLLFAYKRIKMIQIDMILFAYAINLNLNILPSSVRCNNFNFITIVL